VCVLGINTKEYKEEDDTSHSAAAAVAECSMERAISFRLQYGPSGSSSRHISFCHSFYDVYTHTLTHNAALYLAEEEEEEK